MKQVCFFGIYDSNYSRNRVIRRSLEENGFNIVECNLDPKKYSKLIKYLKLFQKAWSIRSTAFSFVLVAFPGHSVVWLAKLIFKGTIVFDAFLSVSDSNYNDRKVYNFISIRHFYDLFLDWSSCFFADVVILDTYEHIKFFNKNFMVSRSKMVRVLVGTSEDVFYPREGVINKQKLIHFHGYFIPLHGVSHIIEAAKILENENIIFNLIGKGQEYLMMKKKVADLNLTNVNFIDPVTLSELPNYIKNADVCLGIFGDTPKVARVIPNKIYEYIAMGKIVISADTPAIRELFKDGENIVLCPSGDSENLAMKIKTILTDLEMNKKIGKNARILFENKLQTKSLSRDLLLKLGYIN